MTLLRVAAFQRRPHFDDVAAILARLIIDLEWCDKRDIDLAVFPECYLQGYACDRETIARRAFALDGVEMSRIVGTLARFRVNVILGLIERRSAALHNSAAIIGAGNLFGVYAKSHPNERGFDAGTEYPVFQLGTWSFGVNICNDANFLDPALKVKEQGARLLCYPLNNMLPRAIASEWRSKSIDNLRHKAIATGCWVVSSDVVGEHEGKLSYGCTCIVQPDGLVVRRSPEGMEDVIAFDLQ